VSASTLRAAAALIRERANAAAPGPWSWGNRGISGDDFEDVLPTGTIDERFGPNAAYIATMHPDVALAVADLIDTILKVGPVDGGAEWDATVTLARTYLGNQS
jgi:hypothetical protein